MNEHYLNLDELVDYLHLKNRRGADRFAEKIGAKRRLPGATTVYDAKVIDDYLKTLGKEAANAEA